MYLHALVHLQVSQLLKYLDWNKTYYLIAAKLSLNNWLFFSEFLSLSRKYRRDILLKQGIFFSLGILENNIKMQIIVCNNEKPSASLCLKS